MARGSSGGCQGKKIDPCAIGVELAGCQGREGFKVNKIYPCAVWVEVAGCQRGGGVKVNKINLCAIGVELASCQGVLGVKVKKIDPCAIKTSLTQKTGDQRLNYGDISFSPSLGSQKRLCSQGGQVTAYENKHCIILVQSPISSRLKAI